MLLYQKLVSLGLMLILCWQCMNWYMMASGEGELGERREKSKNWWNWEIPGERENGMESGQIRTKDGTKDLKKNLGWLERRMEFFSSIMKIFVNIFQIFKFVIFTMDINILLWKFKRGRKETFISNFRSKNRVFIISLLIKRIKDFSLKSKNTNTLF